MKRMCAWCGRELDQVERCENQPLTHGLCPECRRRYFAVAEDRDAPAVETGEEKVRADLPFERP
jgi:NMD protein affecting ribosome stability and mRNA decay